MPWHAENAGDKPDAFERISLTMLAERPGMKVR